jgi:hypothetical protein
LRKLSLLLALKIFLSASLTSVAMAQAPAGLMPISPDRIHEDRLIGHDENFSILLPKGDWQWFEHEEPERNLMVYSGIDRTTHAFVSITTTRKVYRRFDPGFIGGVAHGMQKQWTASGALVRLEPPRPSNAPLPRALALDGTIQFADRPLLHSRSLIFKRGYMYVIQAISEEDPSPLLQQIAGSFELLGTPDVADLDLSGPLTLVAFASLLFMLVGAAINALVKKKAVNGAAWSAVLMVAAFAASTATLSFIVDLNADSGDRAEAFGALLGAIVIPFAIAIALARRFERKRVHERALAGAPQGSVAAASMLLGFALFLGGGFLVIFAAPDDRRLILTCAVAQFVIMTLSIVVFVRDARRRAMAAVAAGDSAERAVSE